MQFSGWIYFGVTTALLAAFVVAVCYCFSPKRRTKVEMPRFRMLDDDDVAPRGPGENGSKGDGR